MRRSDILESVIDDTVIEDPSTAEATAPPHPLPGNPIDADCGDDRSDVATIPFRFQDGEWFRKDGRPVRLLVGPGGSHLECLMTGRREKVDALRLATWFGFNRLVPHDPHPSIRRSRRSRSARRRRSS